MATEFTGQNWKSFLPAVFDWAGKVDVKGTTDWSVSSSVLVVPVKIDENKKIELPQDKILDAIRAEIMTTVTQLDWKGQGNSLPLQSSRGHILLSKISTLKVNAVRKSRQFGIDIAAYFKDRGLDNLTLHCAFDLQSGSVFEGLCQGLYEAKLFSGNKPSQSLAFPKSLTFVTSEFDENRFNEHRYLAQAAVITRMLQDAPANILTPRAFAEIASSIASEKNFKTEILGRSEIEKEGMGAFLSVAKGSVLEPRLISVEIPGQNTQTTVSLVGKGLTFDAGGISIKPAAGMDEMKYDMSGGAAVIGSLFFFSKVTPEVNVRLLIGAVENMCSGTATRPGDIVQASNGKTIEVLNTDAEGRLVLADVLSYTVKYHKPQLIVDAATLTGACLYALGHCGSALLSNDDQAAERVLHAAEEAGEPLWRLPLWPELSKEVIGTYADLANIPKPNVLAGTIMGGVFLKEFVGETPWVHLDIAGTAWSCQATGYVGGGGSSFGLQTMIAVVKSFAK